MPVTPVQGFRYPAATDAADGPLALRSLGEDVERHVVMRFTNAADRAARLPNPVAGMVAWLADAQRLEVFTSDAWRPVAAQTAVTVDDLPDLVLIAHRGGAGIAPDNTLEAFQAAAALRVAVEPDCWLTADGAVACMHDPTLDATTTGSGPIATIPAHAFTRQVVDASAWFGGGWPNSRPPLLDHVLHAIGGQTVVVPEAKAAGSGPLITDLLVRHGLQQAAIVQSFALAELAPAVSAGIAAMLTTNDPAGLPIPQALRSQGVEWLAVPLTTTPAQIQPFVDAGVHVVVHTVNRHHQRDPWLATGVRGFFTDEPAYLNANPAAYRTTTDPFGAQTWPHGFIRNVGGPRGAFLAPDWWTPGLNNNGFWLQGWACPIPNPTNWTLRLDVRYDTIGTDTSRWPSVFFASSTDHPFDDTTSTPTNNGYHAVFRAAGQLALFRYDNGALTAGPTANLPALANGSVIQVTITVTPSQVAVQRAGHPALVWDDATHRGRYLFLGHNGLTGQQFAFRNLTLT